MEETVVTTPSGWYPDPSGQPQWRVWTGTQWSNVTRPYRLEGFTQRKLLSSLNKVQSIARARYLAPLGYFGALNLLASLLIHWPIGPKPFSDPWLLPLLGLLIFFFVMSWVVTAQAVRSFQENWTFWALVPLGNLLILTGLLRHELLGGTARPLPSDLLGLVMWAIVAPSTPVAGAITALMALAHVQLFSAYLNNVTFD
jgi:hypothetical protein